MRGKTGSSKIVTGDKVNATQKFEETKKVLAVPQQDKVQTELQGMKQKRDAIIDPGVRGEKGGEKVCLEDDVVMETDDLVPKTNTESLGLRRERQRQENLKKISSQWGPPLKWIMVSCGIAAGKKGFRRPRVEQPLVPLQTCGARGKAGWKVGILTLPQFQIVRGSGWLD